MLDHMQELPVQANVQICPKSPAPARYVAAMRLQELTSHSWDMCLSLTCLQGIVNRSQPRLYLVQDRYDELWLELRERGDIDGIEWLEVGQVFDRFLAEVKQMFVTDPVIPASVNVATMLAAVEGGLVATPETAAQYNLPMGALPDSWNSGLDLRTMNWKKNIEAYRWVYQRFGDRLSRQAVAILDPYAIGLRDYLVEFKIPILWISAPQDAERSAQASYHEEYAFAKGILMKLPPNIPCFGWPGNGQLTERGIGEWYGVRLASECGKFEVCSAYDGYSPTVSNLSVHSGTTAQLRQRIPPVKLEREKIYYCFTRSDGDGLNFLRHYYRKLFDDPRHGSVPVGWQVGPTAGDTMPDILDYYFKHARPGDCFINALSGAGYIHEDVFADNYPSDQREQILAEFVRLSGIYRKKLDAAVLATFAEMQPERLAKLAAIEGVRGVMANYGRTHGTTPENLVTESAGRPVFRAVNRQPRPLNPVGGVNLNLPIGLTFTPFGKRNAVDFAIAEINRWTPAKRPAFVHVFLANWLTEMEMAADIAKGLGPEYLAVRPDQLVALYEESKK
jgi:hypothetical protein